MNREGCSSSEFFQFHCPNDPNNEHAHPRYPDPTGSFTHWKRKIFYALSGKWSLVYILNCCNFVFADCQYFFLCLNGKDARRNGCQVNWLLPITFQLISNINQFLLFNIILINFLLQTGLLFNQKTKSCDRQENLAPNDPCRGYYNETFLEGLRGKSRIWKLVLPSHIIIWNWSNVVFECLFMTSIGGPSGLPQVGRPAGFKKTGTGIQLNTK